MNARIELQLAMPNAKSLKHIARKKMLNAKREKRRGFPMTNSLASSERMWSGTKESGESDDSV